MDPSSTASLIPHASPASPPPRELPALRVEIDSVDKQLVALLNQRSALVIEVGRRKMLDGTPVYAPHREQAVLAKVLAMSGGGPTLPATLEAIWREIMSGSFALERPLRIGYLGPAGSFTHDAACKHFGASVSYEDMRAIGGAFEEVARGHVDYAVVPCENSTVGSVAETLDAWLEPHATERVSVCAEVQLSVAHALIVAPGAAPSDVREVHSKPEALGQCRRWLAMQYPTAALVAAASSSAAVKMLADAVAAGAPGAKHVAAIGSLAAARLHDLPVLFGDIQDRSPNITRFLVLAARGAGAGGAPSGDDKTALLFVVQERVGSLVDVLEVFRTHRINLTAVEKRPCTQQQVRARARAPPPFQPPLRPRGAQAPPSRPNPPHPSLPPRPPCPRGRRGVRGAAGRAPPHLLAPVRALPGAVPLPAGARAVWGARGPDRAHQPPLRVLRGGGGAREHARGGRGAQGGGRPLRGHEGAGQLPARAPCAVRGALAGRGEKKK